MAGAFPEFTDDERLEWYVMTPQERWAESEKLWELYLSLGGSLDAEPGPQSPFDPDVPHGTAPAYGAPGFKVIRRGAV